uniref:Uncharacterized protein n=1 Tax=Micrurus corallinus TaxID=54390 RepID=A0A2D4EMG8_MICCO
MLVMGTVVQHIMGTKLGKDEELRIGVYYFWHFKCYELTTSNISYNRPCLLWMLGVVVQQHLEANIWRPKPGLKNLLFPFLYLVSPLSFWAYSIGKSAASFWVAEMLLNIAKLQIIITVQHSRSDSTLPNC